MIRRARPCEAERLTAIAHAAKRHWGYADALIRLWDADLTVSAGVVERELIFCATAGTEIVGFYGLSRDSTAFELEHMWVDPQHMKHGHGAQLFAHALATTRSHGGTTLRIASDPNAESFYVRMGAHRIGEEPSVPAGRTLPVLVIETF